MPSPYRLCTLLIPILVTNSIPLRSAEVPVTQIVLYKHGIGYFEREGTVPEGDEARLDFKNGDMNDILKSLTVTDTSGARVSAIRYDSNETLEQQLQKYPFKIGDGEFLSSFLDRLKGAQVELKQAEHTVTGVILSARAVQTGDDNSKRVLRDEVSVLLDGGSLVNFEIGPSTSLRLLDGRLAEQLKQYLQTLAQSKSRDRRSVYIDSAVRGNRHLHVSYISPTAIWKSSYRLTLADPSSLLEGWAIVDNTTEEDWQNVKLSVVSGRPISFVSLLDTPRYGQRQVAELPEDQAAGPVVYGGSVDTSVTSGSRVVDGLPAADNNGNGYGRGSGAGVAGGAYRMRNNLMASQNQTVQVEQSAKLQQSSTIEGATGATLGELFEYSFAGPVTIKKDQSAMLPFLQDKVSARRLLIYTSQDGEHPVNAAEVTNNTRKTLDGGPVTVYDGGAYAGEALFETLKAGDKRLIGYAVDYGTRITTAFDTGQRRISEVHAHNGLLQLKYGEHKTRTYTIRNVDAEAKTLILQQDGVSEYSVLSPKPVERTATAYRFEAKLPANGSESLKVEEERTYSNTTVVMTSTPDFLLTIVTNKQLSDTGRKQLQSVAAVKSSLAEVNSNLAVTETQMTDLTNDQTRLRQNIDSLNRVKSQDDQVRKYSGQLSDNESQLAKLRDHRRDLQARKSSLESDVRAAVDQLDF